MPVEVWPAVCYNRSEIREEGAIDSQNIEAQEEDFAQMVNSSLPDRVPTTKANFCADHVHLVQIPGTIDSSVHLLLAPLHNIHSELPTIRSLEHALV